MILNPKTCTVLLLAVITFFSCAPNKNKELLSEAAYTKRYLDSMELRLPAHKFHIVKDLEIHSADSNRHFLDNAYHAYTKSPEELETIMTAYLNAAMTAYINDSKYSKEYIVPVLKPRQYLDDIANLTEVKLYAEPFASEIIITYVHDSEFKFSFLSQDDLDSMQIHTDTLQQHAVKNLKRILPEIEKIGDHQHYDLVADGIFESSILLLPDFWTKDNFPVEGDIVLSCPSRDKLSIVGSKDQHAVENLRLTTQKSYEEDNYQVSPYLYKYSNGKFVKY